jgi:hypothetical protein
VILISMVFPSDYMRLVFDSTLADVGHRVHPNL